MKSVIRKVLFGLIAVITISAMGTRDGRSEDLSALYRVVSETIRVVTAYNVGDSEQNFGDPCVSANGENICKALTEGESRCAANFVPFGTVLHVDKYGVCLVTDRMNSRYRNRVDIAMKPDEYRKAKTFGKQKLRVKIMKSASDVK